MFFLFADDDVHIWKYVHIWWYCLHREYLIDELC